MCNEELTSNHVCREYLERLQPHTHYSTVPKGGAGQITLTQTSSDCQKNYASLENSIYEEDENSLFNFSTNNPTPNIDVTAKPEYEHPGSVDDIHVSINPRSKPSPSSPELDKPAFPNSWLNTMYHASTPRDFLAYETALIQQRGYYYPIITKLDPLPKSDNTSNSGGSGVDTEYYDPPVEPPKFVRSVKRIKRDAYYVPMYHAAAPDFHKKQNSVKRDKKKLIYPASYHASAEVTKNTNTTIQTEGEMRHAEAEQPRKKRKYIRRTTKEEQIENGTALWQFLMRKLEDYRCKEWIRWTGNDLEFKVLDQKEAARQWGLCKNRTKMTFDKFSRSMRFYYSKGILVHNPDKRLTYIFCRQPHDPVYTEMLERVMKTLPPNTIHCTATCINSEHEHEKIKLNVRRRPKKSYQMKSAKASLVNSYNPVDQAPSRAPEHLITYSRISNYDDPPTKPTDGSYLPGRSDSPYHPDYHAPSNDLYNTSPMAALIAAASQAISASVPEQEVYFKHEMNSPPPHGVVQHVVPHHLQSENVHVMPEEYNMAKQDHVMSEDQNMIAEENMSSEDRITTTEVHMAPANGLMSKDRLSEETHLKPEENHLAPQNGDVEMIYEPQTPVSHITSPDIQDAVHSKSDICTTDGKFSLNSAIHHHDGSCDTQNDVDDKKADIGSYHGLHQTADSQDLKSEELTMSPISSDPDHSSLPGHVLPSHSDSSAAAKEYEVEEKQEIPP